MPKFKPPSREELIARGVLQEETPQEETPQEETPQEETPQEETPQEETPQEETPPPAGNSAPRKRASAKG
jgi:hypothetical protein